MTDMMTDMREDNEEQPKDWFNNLDWGTIFNPKTEELIKAMAAVTALPIKINYHGTQNKLKNIEVGSWIDLYVAENYHLHADEYTQISLGVSMQLPPGYEAILAPRSSTFKKYGLIQTNGIGVIDSTYNGDGDIWQMPVLATKEVWIPEGARICQFRIQEEQPVLSFIEVTSLNNENRGGFGEATKDEVL